MVKTAKNTKIFVGAVICCLYHLKPVKSGVASCWQEMKDKIKKMRFIAFVMLFILTLLEARADAGIPMLAVLWPLSWIAFIPVVIIEAWIAKRIIGLTWKPALIRSGIANAVSTLVGIPLTWFALVLVELVISHGGRAFGIETLPQKIFAAVIQAPWLIPYEEDVYWLVPTAAIVLLVPFFFASVFIERWAFDIKKQIEKPLVRLWSWKANLVTYGIMLLLLICTLIYSIVKYVPAPDSANNKAHLTGRRLSSQKPVSSGYV